MRLRVNIIVRNVRLCTLNTKNVYTWEQYLLCHRQFRSHALIKLVMFNDSQINSVYSQHNIYLAVLYLRVPSKRND